MAWRVAFSSLALALSIALPTSAADDHHAPPTTEEAVDLQEYVPGANRLEGRIRAPCCYQTTGQTLDIHGSEIAYALRREIRKRLKAGETPDAIEASIVARYGEEILAVPKESPIAGMAVGLVVVMVGAGAFAANLLVRWRRRGQRTGAGKSGTKEGTERDALDDRLDAELKSLD